MNAIASFRKCTLSTIELIAKVDLQTDVMFKKQEVPTRHVPAQPNEDYDILIGELLLRFIELEKAKQIEIDTIKEAYAQGRLDEETRFPYATDEDDYFDKKFRQNLELNQKFVNNISSEKLESLSSEFDNYVPKDNNIRDKKNNGIYEDVLKIMDKYSEEKFSEKELLDTINFIIELIDEKENISNKEIKEQGYIFMRNLKENRSHFS